MFEIYSEFTSGCIYFRYHSPMFFRFAKYAAFSDFAAANFKLRFDQNYQTSLSAKQRRHCRHHFRCRNKGDVHYREIKALAEIFRLQIPSVEAFSDFDPRIVAQTPVELIVTDVNCYYSTRAVLQKA